MRRDDDEPLELDDDPPRRRGASAAKKKGMPGWGWALVLAGVMVPLTCCGGGIALWGLKTATDKPTTYTPMTADQLIDEWAVNPAAAVKKYKEDGVELSGRLHRINSNLASQTYIEVRGAGNDSKRHAHVFVLSEKAKDGLAKCTVGGKVVVRARAEGASNPVPWLVADEILPAD